MGFRKGELGNLTCDHLIYARIYKLLVKETWNSLWLEYDAFHCQLAELKVVVNFSKIGNPYFV